MRRGRPRENREFPGLAATRPQKLPELWSVGAIDPE
jgi:hypothetical protein